VQSPEDARPQARRQRIRAGVSRRAPRRWSAKSAPSFGCVANEAGPRLRTRLSRRRGGGLRQGRPQPARIGRRGFSACGLARRLEPFEIEEVEVFLFAHQAHRSSLLREFVGSRFARGVKHVIPFCCTRSRGLAAPARGWWNDALARHSTTFGTRKKLSSRAGAFLRTASGSPPLVTTSGRFFICIGVTDVIGSTPSTSTSESWSK